MIEPHVCDIAPFIRIMEQQFTRIAQNFKTYFTAYFENSSIAAQAAAFAAHGANENGQLPNFEWLPEDLRRQVFVTAQARAQEMMADSLRKNAKDRELLLTGILAERAARQLHFKQEAIGKKYRFFSHNPIEDYKNFSHNSKKLKRLFTQPSEEEKAGATIDFVYSEFHDKPIIFEGFDKKWAIADIQAGIRAILASRAAKADPETTGIIEQYACHRGDGSPYSYSTADLYDFMKTVGASRVKDILATDDRDISRQMQGWDIVKNLGFNAQRLAPDALKKHLLDAQRLKESGVWTYVHEREAPNKHNTRKKNRDLFFEAKRMYWLAKQVFIKNPYKGQDAQDVRFYQSHQYVDWRRYDLSLVEAPDEQLNVCFERHMNLIAALMGQGASDIPEQGNPATLGLIVQALGKGQDLRGVALAKDKQRYLKGVIDGQKEDDTAFALCDWPPELKAAISQEEINT